MFIRDWDKMEFETEEEAFDDACDMMWLYGDIGDYLQNWVSYNELLEWAMDHDGFLEAFDDGLSRAQRDYFEDFCFEIEDDEDENSECESESDL